MATPHGESSLVIFWSVLPGILFRPANSLVDGILGSVVMPIVFSSVNLNRKIFMYCWKFWFRLPYVGLSSCRNLSQSMLAALICLRITPASGRVSPFWSMRAMWNCMFMLLRL